MKAFVSRRMAGRWVTAGAMSLASVVVAAQEGWRADPQLVEKSAERQPAINYHEEKVPDFTLPALFPDGRVPRTPEEWRPRREEILELFREHVYGRSPGRPDRLDFEVVERDDAAMGGAATLTRVAIVSTQAGRHHRFVLTLFVPNGAKGPVPVFLLLNNRPPGNVDPARAEKSGFWPAEAVIARGYGIAALQVSDLAPDDKEQYRQGVIGLFRGNAVGDEPSAWKALGAWAWGASRALDYFETHPAVDARRVAVVGHSRGGKAALWAGAQDERFALVVSNESGEGGAALSRRHYGETIERITTVFPHWFAGRYSTYTGRPEALPVDQHMLLALIAPRPLYVASADEDLWADPRGEFMALAHASPAYALWGDPPIAAEAMPPLEQPLVAGRRGYHVRRGGHNLTPYDWERFMDFADRMWREPAAGAGTPHGGARR